MAGDRWVCVWTYHHLLLDARVDGARRREILASYEALAANRPRALAPAPQFRDYIAWIAGQDPSAAEEFWARKTIGFEAATPLPGSKTPSSSARGVAGQHESLVLTSAATEALMRLARSTPITLNTIVQSAWALALARWSGRDDVCFGTTVSCRPATLAGADEMIGVFVNTVPVRTVIGGNDGAWLGGCRASSPIFWSMRPRCRTARVRFPRRLMFESVLVFQNHLRTWLPATRYRLKVSGLGRM